MSTRAHVIIVVLSIAILAGIFWLVNKRQLRSKYGLLWLAVAVLLLPLAVFPSLLTDLSHAVGIAYPPTTFLLLGLGFVFVIVVHYSWELSRAENRLRALAEEVALLKYAVENGGSSPAGHAGTRTG
jgi:hypothetical protein